MYYDGGRPKGPVKKPLTAETAEKKILRILGELCLLCVQTSHFSHAGPEPLIPTQERRPGGMMLLVKREPAATVRFISRRGSAGRGSTPDVHDLHRWGK